MKLRRARVRVPCSTSNLGAGFDCLGLALDRYLHAEFIPGDHTLTVQRAGTAAAVTDDRDYVRALFQDELARLGHAQACGTLQLNSDIPLGRGLGSSSRIFDRQAQGLAFDSGAILQIEPHAADRRGARGDRQIEHLAEARELVDPELEAVPREVAAQRLSAAGEVVLRLQLVRAGLDRILRKT